MAEVIVNYKSIIECISSQIDTVWKELARSADENTQKEMSNIKGIEISDEQNFMRKQDVLGEQGIVYIVVKFGAGSINFGSSVCPVSLMCMGTANKIKPVQLLMSVFASFWTTKNLENNGVTETTMLQVWNTPEVMANFTEVNLEFRNLLRVSGNIVIGPAAIRMGTMTYYYDDNGTEKSEQMSIMSFQDQYNASMDTQPFGNTDGFTKSEVNFSTYAFSSSTYLLDSHFSNDMLAIRGFRYRPNCVYNSATSKFAPNQWIKIKLEFTNGYTNMSGTNETKDETTDPVKGEDFFSYFKIAGSKIGQELAGLPTLSVAFAH